MDDSAARMNVYACDSGGMQASDLGEEDKAEVGVPRPQLFGVTNVDAASVLVGLLAALDADAALDVGQRGYPMTVAFDPSSVAAPADRALIAACLKAAGPTLVPLRLIHVRDPSVRLAALTVQARQHSPETS